MYFCIIAAKNIRWQFTKWSKQNQFNLHHVIDLTTFVLYRCTYLAPICGWDLLCRPADWLWRTCCKMDSPFHYNWPWDLGLGCSACCTFVLQLSWIRAVGSMAVIKQRAHWKCPVTVAIAAAESPFYVKCSKMCVVTVWPFLTKFEYRSHQNYLLRCKFYCYFCFGVLTGVDENRVPMHVANVWQIAQQLQWNRETRATGSSWVSSDAF